MINKNIVCLRCLGDTLNEFSKNNMKNLKKAKIKTGFDQLDTMLGGGISSGLTVLGAISGLGKSTLTLQIAEHISSNGNPVLYFSLEMPHLLIAAKAISRQYFIDVGYKKNIGITANDLIFSEKPTKLGKRFWQAVGTVKANNSELFIMERPLIGQDVGLTAENIHNIVADYIDSNEKEGLRPVVIVDYLQILPPDIKPFLGSDKQAVDKTVSRMTQLAMEKEIPVILISSLSRAGSGEKVKLEYFKETGGIEYSADVVLGLSFTAAPERIQKDSKFDLNAEKGKFPRNVELTALKQRYGSSGSSSTVQMEYFAEFDYFREVGTDKKQSDQKTDGQHKNFYNASQAQKR